MAREILAKIKVRAKVRPTRPGRRPKLSVSYLERLALNLEKAATQNGQSTTQLDDKWLPY
jgi:hypothetical protein